MCARSDNVSGVFGERRPPPPAGRPGRKDREGRRRGGFISRGPLARSGAAGVAMSRYERKRGKYDETYGPIGGSGEEGLREGRGGRGGIKKTDVYLAFPIPARRLVSCLLSPAPSVFRGPPPLTEHIERGCESARAKGWMGAGRGLRRKRRANVTRRWGCWCCRRGPRTTLSTIVGGEATPSRTPRKGVGERGVLRDERGLGEAPWTIIIIIHTGVL